MDTPIASTGLLRRVKWWWRGRDWRTFLFGFPALSTGVGVAILIVLCLASSPRDLQARYLAEGKSAFQAKNYPRALTCYERSTIFAPEQHEVIYRLALTVEASGDAGRAAQLMRTLVQEGNRGYPPAHYWWARQLLASSQSSPKALALAEVHLVRALDGELDDRESVHGLIGTLYLSSGRLEDAEFHLTKAASARPVFRLPLARVFALRGNPTRARQEAEVAVRHYRDRLKVDPGNIANRLAFADATTFLDDFPAAVAILEDGFSTSKEPIYRLALAKVYVGWYDWRKKQAATTAGELIVLLDKGLACDAANRDLLNRLIEELRLGGAGVDPSRKTLHELLAKGGTAVGPIHFALAVDARLRGDREAEALHLERALQLDPQAPLIANNLAWVLSQPPNPDLPRALALAGIAVEREPNNANYRDTRARVYMAQGRWKDALADFETILRKAPNTPGLHAALAEVYEKLNQPELAAEHKALADAMSRMTMP